MTSRVRSVTDRDEQERAQRRLHRDVVVVALLIGLFGAVRLLRAVPWWVGLLVVFVGAVAVRPKVLLLGFVLLLAARSGAVLGSLNPATTQPLDQVQVSVVSDPRPNELGWNAEGKVGDETLSLSVRFGAAPGFGAVQVGDSVVISGTLRGVAPETDWAISRRVVGRLSVSQVHGVRDAGGVTGAANALRSTYRAGVRHFDQGDQALFTGLVYGDDRDQDPIDADNFRAAGLGHLLAVSGQNVAFVLLLFAPLLERIRRAPVRIAVALSILAAFGVLTRFEASVSRAIVMAGMALLAHALGRRSSAAHVLVPAVAVLLIVDPLIAWSLAFQLSVAATTGMIVLAPRIAVLLPGPSALAAVTGATLGAQLAVSPLLLIVFGRISLVAAPANVLAGPAAAGVMMWGLVAGVVSGISPPVVAPVVHLPTQLLISWISLVATVFADISVGHFSWLHLGTFSLGLALMLRTHQQRHRLPGWAGLLLVVLAIGVPVLSPKPLATGVHHVSPEITVARSLEGHDVVILDGGVRVSDALEQLRMVRVDRIDLLIATSGSRNMGRVVHTLSEAFSVEEIWAPEGHEVAGAMGLANLSGTLGTLTICDLPGAGITVFSSPFEC